MIGVFARVGWEGKESIRYLSEYSWLLPQGVNPIAVNKYIISYYIISRTDMERTATLVVQTTTEVTCVKCSHICEGKYTSS